MDIYEEIGLLGGDGWVLGWVGMENNFIVLGLLWINWLLGHWMG